ncbi:hypothetical protein ACX3VT_04175 [Aerococcus sanguinicola]|uniref:hypothetical protein n=1 Tax=unclassified Aerococcus TaxID=2618060 RepID=UPI0008A2FE13|nr:MULTISPECIES: hypothetical protein [unclassified Aerococcus]KAB0647877.1 hypothetical protein F6I01_00075 [Aerococcus sanguinicola]MDK6234218.1 hypothetical protein [Aerococcus sp. UMB10185]MDK6804436.1 hypothetical protein [Aerococcus sp. UMB7834]MDK6856635.1 hypothetical protein [Aerococcus sp. UMB7533]MDK8503209.1 hypothetical protein [Aerococcus sp. UMB1112A]
MIEDLFLVDSEKFIERLLLAQTITQIENLEEIILADYPTTSELALGLVECFHDLETATYLPLIEKRIGEAFVQLYTLSRMTQIKLELSYRYVEELSVSRELGLLVKGLRNEGLIYHPLNHLLYALWAMSEAVFDLSFPETIYAYAKELALDTSTDFRPSLG